MLDALFRAEGPKRLAPAVREQQIEKFQSQMQHEKEAFIFSKNLQEENWRSPDPAQFIKRYSFVASEPKPVGVRHLAKEIDAPSLMPSVSKDQSRDFEALKMQSRHHIIHDRVGPQAERCPDPAQYALRYATPGLNLFQEQSGDIERVQNLGNDVLSRPRGRLHKGTPIVDPRVVMPAATNDQIKESKASRIAECNDPMLDRKLGPQHWRSPNKAQFALRYAKPNYNLFEKYGSFPPVHIPGRGQPRELPEEKLRPLMNESSCRLREAQADSIASQPSMVSMLQGGGDPFVSPSNKVLRAKAQQDANAQNFGKAQHGMLDGVMANSDVRKPHGRRSNLPDRAHSSMDIPNEVPILGFKGVGSNNFEHLHPNRWQLSKHAIDSDPLAIKRPPVLDLPKVLELNQQKHPHFWKRHPTAALITNNKTLMEELVPAERVHHVKNFVPLPISHKAVIPETELPGFHGMGKYAIMPNPGKKHVAADIAKLRPAPHVELEMRYRRSQSVSL